MTAASFLDPLPDTDPGAAPGAGVAERLPGVDRPTRPPCPRTDAVTAPATAARRAWSTPGRPVPVVPTGGWTVDGACQRWDHGRSSWRRVAEGGFDSRLYQVAPLEERLAAAFVRRHHYAGSYPPARLVYGLFTVDDRCAPRGGEVVDGRHLVGVAVLSVPMSERVLTQVFPHLEPYQESLELGRFVLTDTPANAETWFLGRIWRLATEQGIRGVVSFADPMPRHRRVEHTLADGTRTERVEILTPGHVGVIYQAHGGHACGRSTPRTLVYLPRRGEVLSARTLSKIRAQESGAAAAEARLVSLGASPRHPGQDPAAWLTTALDELGACRRRHPGNFRYAWPLGSPAQRRRVHIALPRTPYPKPATDLILEHREAR